MLAFHARLRSRLPLALLVLSLSGLSLSGLGCNLKRMAVNQTAKVLKAGAPALEREWDYDLAAVAIPANVKVIESFLLSADNNRDLLELEEGAPVYARVKAVSLS